VYRPVEILRRISGRTPRGVVSDVFAPATRHNSSR
jgi:hypothetical protein